ncbi:MAG: peptide ABC transporter substrate-binding protein, partial [Alkalispirochaeta sp.]
MKRFFLVCVIVPAVLSTITHPLYPQDRSEGDDEFVISFLSGNFQLNPVYSFTASEAQIYSGLYEGLVGYHPLTMEPVPAVAERWDVSDNGLVYTFHLRDDARFSNGDPVTAGDFRETWLRVIDPDTEAAYNFLYDVIDGVRAYRAGRTTDPRDVGIRVIDEKTLEVRLHQPATHFLRILCHHAFVPLHPDLRETDDWSDIESPPTNGPYRLVERSEDELLLRRSPRYWDADSVEIGQMRILFTEEDEATSVTDRFNRGVVDWVTGGMDLSEVQFPEMIVVNPLFATTYYFLRADVEPFSDDRVRRALALLLPWEEIRSPDIHLSPATTLVPPIPYYPEIDGITEQRLDQALALLDEAGYTRGVRIPGISVHIPQGEETMRVAEIMQESWEEHLEVSVDIQVTPYPAYFDALGESDFTVGTVSWIGDFADPLTFLQMWISDSNVNDAGFTNLRYDRLIDDSMVERGKTRYEILGRAEELLLQTGTVLPVSHSPSINLIDL